jgi:hypothetical protein
VNATGTNCGGKRQSCINQSHPDRQLMPMSGPLARQRDMSLSALTRSIPAELQTRPIYVYVIKTVGNENGQFVQTGSAPNFQGGCITLCTCKHKDRAYSPKAGCHGPDLTKPWKGIWVAGICGPAAFSPRGLFYLMLVGEVFDNHADIWQALKQPVSKSATRNVFGDIYEPKSNITEKWVPENYKLSTTGHVHENEHARRNDIEGVYRPDRRPKLLLGDVKRSYLWSCPLVRLKQSTDEGWKTAHHRFYPRLRDFTSQLQ